jgi:hypothetical protein
MTGFNPHPRLLVTPASIGLARRADRHPRVREAAAAVDAAAKDYARSPRFDFDPHNGHNAHLIRARRLQTRVVTLLAAWARSEGSAVYRKAVLDHLAEMDSWEFWSWIAWRQGLKGPEAIFDLSYGENSATLALAYDLLAPDLSEAERSGIRDLAARRALASFRIHTDPAKPAWWMNRPDSNWQTVCAGGGGMLALAMAGELPDMETLIARSDDAVLRYMQKVDEYGGGCVEGLGYWNYGMRYAWLYLLSHEAATGESHPALRLRGSRQTLRFPIELNPGGVPCGFGDINHPWHPLAFHFAAAARFQDDALVRSLAAVLPEKPPVIDNQGWPQSAELCFFMPEFKKGAKPKKAALKPHSHLYPGMDWGVLASSPDHPQLAATVRGGTTEGPHSHLDVLSYQLALDGEAMVSSISNRGYMDSTFSDRRFEIWEISAAAKNTLFIGGAGLSKPASVETKPVKIGSFHGFHMQANEAIRIKMYGNPLVKRIERLFLMQADKYFIVVDHVELVAPNQVESRFHTFAGVDLEADGARLTGRKAVMRVGYAATEPYVLKRGMGTPTDPAAPVSTLVRLFSKKLTPRITFATVFSTGAPKLKISFSTRRDGRLSLTLQGRAKSQVIPLPFTQETAS